jgi:hypothetical protein
VLLVESFVEVTAVLFLLVASLCNSIYLLLRRTLVHFVFHSSFKKTHLIFSALNIYAGLKLTEDISTSVT